MTLVTYDNTLPTATGGGPHCASTQWNEDKLQKDSDQEGHQRAPTQWNEDKTMQRQQRSRWTNNMARQAAASIGKPTAPVDERMQESEGGSEAGREGQEW